MNGIQTTGYYLKKYFDEFKHRPNFTEIHPVV